MTDFEMMARQQNQLIGHLTSIIASLTAQNANLRAHTHQHQAAAGVVSPACTSTASPSPLAQQKRPREKRYHARLAQPGKGRAFVVDMPGNASFLAVLNEWVKYTEQNGELEHLQMFDRTGNLVNLTGRLDRWKGWWGFEVRVVRVS